MLNSDIAYGHLAEPEIWGNLGAARLAMAAAHKKLINDALLADVRLNTDAI